MQLSELSARTGVSVASLKYYLREGVLMPGEQVRATRASYGEEHVARVRLIRALLDVGRLSMAQVTSVVDALSEQVDSPVEVMGLVQDALPGPRPAAEESAEVRHLIDRLGWGVHPATVVRRSLSAALDAARAGGVPISEDRLVEYAEAAHAVARTDLEVTREQATLTDALHVVVVGTVLLDPVFSALRRLAQQDVAQEMFG